MTEDKLKPIAAASHANCKHWGEYGCKKVRAVVQIEDGAAAASGTLIIEGPCLLGWREECPWHERKKA